jgi:hypothetical protein
MKTNQHIPVFFFIAAFFACLIATTACIVPKWFEYAAEWNPPKVEETPYLSNTQELLPLFGIGPETFSQHLEDSDTTGCYVVGMCSPNEVPHRLYSATFSDAQKRKVSSMRFIGILGIVTNLIVLIFIAVKYRVYFRLLGSHRPTRLALGCISLVLVGVIALSLAGLRYSAPYIGAVFGSSEYPANCVTSSPPDVECLGHLGTPPDGKDWTSPYTLQSGTSKWKFDRILFQGPAWTLFSLMPVPAVWLTSKLWVVKAAG